jgi:hypothetical protein
MPRIFKAPPGFVLNPDYLVPELKAQRDALLEALKLAADFLEHSTEFRIGHPGFEGAQAKARAAIKSVEEGK